MKTATPLTVQAVISAAVRTLTSRLLYHQNLQKWGIRTQRSGHFGLPYRRAFFRRHTDGLSFGQSFTQVLEHALSICYNECNFS